MVIFESTGINYTKYNITQALDLKSKLELLNVCCNFNTLVLFLMGLTFTHKFLLQWSTIQ